MIITYLTKYNQTPTLLNVLMLFGILIYFFVGCGGGEGNNHEQLKDDFPQTDETVSQTDETVSQTDETVDQTDETVSQTDETVRLSVNSAPFNANAHESITDRTNAIQRCIDEVYRRGGGQVVIPAKNSYLIGTIKLLDDVELVVQEGAMLLGSQDIKDYGPQALIHAEADNVSISGKGTIDGHGESYWDPVPPKVYPPYAWNYHIAHDWNHKPERPKLISFRKCDGVSISGITLKRSATWTLELLACDNVVVTGITINNELLGPNTDGIDIVACRNVLISDCTINTGDDGIVVKNYWEVFRRPSRDITVTGCTIGSNGNGLKIGTETEDDISNVRFENCIVTAPVGCSGPYSGIAIEMTDGALLSDVLVRDIEIYDAKAPIFVWLGNRHRFYHLNRIEKNEKGNSRMRNVVIENVKAKIDWRNQSITSSITGCANHIIEDITLRNIDIQVSGGIYASRPEVNKNARCCVYPESRHLPWPLPAYGLYCSFVNNLRIENFTVRTTHTDFRPAAIYENVTNRVGSVVGNQSQAHQQFGAEMIMTHINSYLD